jgi:transposase
MPSLYRLPDSRWNEIKPLIEPRPRKPKTDLQLTIRGIIWLLQNGCKWESLPPDYGPYQRVWYYFNKWMVFGVPDQLLSTLSGKVRTGQGRNPEPTLAVAGSQSTKTVAGTNEEKGYDGGKKVTGRKCHVAVDTQGKVLAAGVTAAKVHDKPGALSLKLHGHQPFGLKAPDD